MTNIRATYALNGSNLVSHLSVKDSDEKNTANISTDADKLNEKSLLKNTVLTDSLLLNALKGTFNGMPYSVNEENINFSQNKKYSGTINGKSSKYIINPEQGKFHKGKIQGNIGNDNVNLIVSSDLFGRKTISGLYNDNQIELSISDNRLSTNIEGKNTNIKLTKNIPDKSLEGKFEYNNELMPLILSYIKCSKES